MPSQQSFDPMEFRKTLGTFTTGVTVITTRTDDGEPIGITANSFNSVSLDPPMILWSLAKTARSLAAFESAKHWAVHILADDQESLSNNFAKRGEDKFASIETDDGIGHIPLLRGCASVMECQTEYKYEGGDHIIFVGRVLNFQHTDKEPLVFLRGRYAMAAGKPSSDEIKDATLSQFSSNALDYLLPRAHYQIYSRVRKHHTQHDLSDAQYFVLCSLIAQNHRSHKEINTMFTATQHQITDQDLGQLAERGLISMTAADNDKRLTLTDAGRELALKIIAETKSIEADILAHFDEFEIVMLKKLLRRLVDITDVGLPKMWSQEE